MDEQTLNFDDNFDFWYPAWWENFWVCGGLIVLLFFIVYAIIKLRSWYGSVEQTSDPRKWALKRLYAVNPSAGLQQRHEFKHFYQEVLAIIKEYLARRYGYPSESRTDMELLDYLKERQAQSEVATFYTVVQRLVEHGLSVKFALAQGSSERIKADYCIVMALFEQEKK